MANLTAYLQPPVQLVMAFPLRKNPFSSVNYSNCLLCYVLQHETFTPCYLSQHCNCLCHHSSGHFTVFSALSKKLSSVVSVFITPSTPLHLTLHHCVILCGGRKVNGMALESKSPSSLVAASVDWCHCSTRLVCSINTGLGSRRGADLGQLTPLYRAD